MIPKQYMQNNLLLIEQQLEKHQEILVKTEILRKQEIQILLREQEIYDKLKKELSDKLEQLIVLETSEVSNKLIQLEIINVLINLDTTQTEKKDIDLSIFIQMEQYNITEDKQCVLDLLTLVEPYT